MRTTPTLPMSPIFLTISTSTDMSMFNHMQARLVECTHGAAILTPWSVATSLRRELGEAEAEAGMAAARLHALDGAELLVAEVSDADAGVGAEVMYALHNVRIPVLCVHRKGTSCAMLSGISHPLLTTGEYADEAELDALLDEFATPPEQPGRIFVVEGGDGAGKQTQSAMLRERLRSEGYPVSTLDYPHDAALHGKLIRTLLSGAKGDIKALNPLLFASLYAVNRADTAPLLNAWLKKGHNVILDRYVEANFGHQASKLPKEERPGLIKQLAAFEHDWLDLPRAHRVVYLDLPPQEAAKAMAADGSRASLDIHETAGGDYKAAVRETFLWCAEEHSHWVRVACVDDAGGRYSKQELSDVLYARLAGEFVNQKKTTPK